MLSFDKRISLPGSWKRQLFAVCLIAGLSSRHIVNGLPFSQPSSFTDSASPWTAYPTKVTKRNSQLNQENDEQSHLTSLSELAGTSALDNVRMLASNLAESTGGSRTTSDKSAGGYLRRAKAKISKSDSKSPRGTGGLVYNNEQYNTNTKDEMEQAVTKSPTKLSSTAETEIVADLEVSPSSNKEEQVWTALANLELDSMLFWFVVSLLV